MTPELGVIPGGLSLNEMVLGEKALLGEEGGGKFTSRPAMQV
jgi:hypothetical protein